MVHDLQVSRQCYKISGNVRNLIDLLFFCNKTFWCECQNPRDADHIHGDLNEDCVGISTHVHKHAYYLIRKRAPLEGLPKDAYC